MGARMPRSVLALGAALVLFATALASVDAEAWTTRRERPPRLGVWFYTGPINPAVNFLVPHGQRYRFAKPAPWTKEWFAYCAARWPSFDPNTGTIVTPDGVRMCL